MLLLQRLVDRQAARAAPRRAAGCTKPMIALKSVDLPLPLTPTSAQIVPGSSSNEASRTAVRPLAIGHGEIAHRDAGAGRRPLSGAMRADGVGCVHLPKPFAMVSTVTFSRSR